MAFNCPECGFELPGTPERTVDCFFCGWKPARESEPAEIPSLDTLEYGVISITGNGSGSEGGYEAARAIIAEKYKNLSYRKMAKEYGVKKGRIDSVAAALCAVAHGDETQPGILVLLGLEPKKTEIEVCPTCGDKAHGYDCGSQIVKPKPKPRPKRKRRRYFKCRPDDIEQTMRQLEKHYPGEFKRTE